MREVVVTSFCTKQAAAAKEEAIQFFPGYQSDDRRIATASLSGKMSTLRLDSDIRNWVLIPITVAMFFVGIVRHNIGKLMHRDRKVDLKALREAQAVIRAERLRNNSGYLQSAGFRMRKHFFCAPVSDQSTPRGPVVPLSSMAPALVPSRPQRLT